MPCWLAMTGHLTRDQPFPQEAIVGEKIKGKSIKLGVELLKETKGNLLRIYKSKMALEVKTKREGVEKIMQNSRIVSSF